MAKGQIKQKQATIKQSIFEELCKIQCTKEEICSVLNVCYDTLNSWCNATYGKDFSLIFKEKREGGKASLRRKQFKVACENENPTMLVWLGKQYLGQTDKQENVNMEKVTIVNDINSEVSR